MSDETKDLSEIDALDPEFYRDYEDAKPVGRTLPPDGAYTVQMPETMPDDAFTVRQSKDGVRFLSITLDPLTLVGGEFDGTVVKFLRVTTLPMAEFKQEGSAWVKGRTLHASDAADVLQNFGTGDTPTNVEEFKQAFRRLCGLTSPHPFYLVWSGYDKHGATSKEKYLKSKDFPLVTAADGTKTRPNFVERANPATGESYRVWANLSLGRRGAAPKAVAA